MKKAGTDTKVKKTLIRNYEKKVTKENVVAHENSASTSKQIIDPKIVYHSECYLNQPIACSSEALANYLNDNRNDLVPTLSEQDLNVDKAQLNAKVTKKLNFHFNDRIYKDLVELNADVASSKSIVNKKNTKLKPNITAKRDLEPNIEDFCNNEKDNDLCPDITLLKPKLNRVIILENGDLHNLVATFENL